MTLQHCTLVISLFLTTSQAFCDHKIVYLISPPRTLSTVFLRMMGNRPDFEVLNEPAQFAYCKATKKPELAKAVFKETMPDSVETLKNLILEKAQNKNVFIKDISWYMEKSVVTDLDFIQRSNVYFLFLLRNPHDIIMSLYNRLSTLGQIEQHTFSATTGYKALTFIYTQIKNKAHNKPCVILTEDLYERKNHTLQQLCNFLDIENCLEMHSWDPIEEKDLSTVSELWNDPKKTQCNFLHWHGSALKSSGLHTPTTYKTTLLGAPTFEEIKNTKDKEICRYAYEQNMPYYKALLHEPYLLKNYRSDLKLFIPAQ